MMFSLTNFFPKIKLSFIKNISLKIDKKINYILFFISISFLILGFIIFERNLSRQRKDFERIEYAYEVIQNLSQLKIVLLKLEELFLENKDFTAEKNKIFPLVHKLMILTMDNQLQKKNLIDLDTELKKTFDSIGLLNLSLIKQNRFKILNIIEEEKKLLAKRKEISKKDLVRFEFLFILFISLSIIFLVFLFSIINIQLESRIKSEEEIIELNNTLEDRIQFQSQLLKSDQMTGAINKSYLMILLENHIRYLKENSEPFSFAYIDVDNFKWVNDNLGHDIGDKVLIQVAKIGKNYLEAMGYFARIGGDEFAILVPFQSYEIAKALIKSFQHDCNKYFKKEKLPVSLSIGLITLYNLPESIEKLIQETDNLMYKVKKKSKNGLMSKVL